ncbi:hypothetical protein LUZ61_007803 [Rhynchospora tenuis]|uniref:Aspergillus nuclease S1 n=1 Tax=Rhynchospora tenuis TaxID=198213 RepID=A0AAD6EWV3_9POAL|nr:hypothetical protein LUZ61_007803 [Rhynchospora tenuis]
MGLTNFVYIIIFVFLMAGAPLSYSWGVDGHYMICRIAQRFLNSPASSAVLDLLPSSANGDLASVCSWADNVRAAYPWSSPLHYVDTPDNLCTYNYTRDCHDSSGNAGNCVVGALNNYSAQLLQYQSSIRTYNLTQALMFFAHFMGDIHQPLHVGFTTDEGGNSITEYWYNTKTNLHSVWDTEIIRTAMSNYYGNDRDTMADSIRTNITRDQIQLWDSYSSYYDLATESIQDACSYAYKDASQNARLNDTYFLSRKSIVETRIAQAGFRLGFLLSQIFL